MAKLTLHHVITRLLRDGIIEGSKNQSLFDTLLDQRTDLENHLRLIGMELVVLADIRVAHARNMSDAALDALSDDLKCEPITTLTTHKRLGYYDSVAVVYFRMSLDQEARQGGDPIWLSEEEVIEALSQTYTESITEDRIALEKRIHQVLKRLHELNLLSFRQMGKASTYRGRPLMLVAFSRDQITDFARTLNLIADEVASEPKGKAPFQPVDLDPDLSDLEPVES